MFNQLHHAKPFFSIIAIAFIVASTVISLPAKAADEALKNALAKAQYMLRQTTTEKAEMEKELSKAKQENEELSKEIAKLKKDAENKQNASTAQQSKMMAASEELQKSQQKIELQIEKNKELNIENTHLSEKLAAQSNNFDICYKNNKELYNINQEILGKYQQKGFWEALSQKEPVTAIARIKIENLVQDYQYKIDKLEVNVISDNQVN